MSNSPPRLPRHKELSLSTKCSIKYLPATPDEPGVHLYEEAFDRLGDDAPPVYLQLDGVAATRDTLPGGGASVTLTLPRKTAQALGLICADLKPAMARVLTESDDLTEADEPVASRWTKA